MAEGKPYQDHLSFHRNMAFSVPTEEPHISDSPLPLNACSQVRDDLWEKDLENSGHLGSWLPSNGVIPAALLMQEKSSCTLHPCVVSWHTVSKASLHRSTVKGSYCINS